MYGMRAQDNAPATHFRSDRLCRVNGELYFSTRENTLEGPFAMTGKRRCGRFRRMSSGCRI
jgi:hypothetical protein